MDRETALRIWNEVPGLANVVTGRSLEEFATRIEQLEREACAKVVEAEHVGESIADNCADSSGDEAYNTALRHAAAAIRERSNFEVSGLAPRKG